MSRALSRRAFGASLLAGLAVAACGVNGPSASPAATLIAPRILPTATASPASGKLLLVHGGNLFDFDLATLKESPLTHFGQNVYAASPALSPDGQRLVYTFYQIPQDQKDLGGSDLYVSNVDASEAKLVRAHPAPGASFEEPAWTADGKAILATLRSPRFQNGQYAGDSVAIQRVGLDGAAPVQVVENAQSAAVSPDGRRLVYLTSDNSGQTNRIWNANVDGSGARQLAADAKFSLVRAPRFSPDGNRIALGAVGGPTQAPPPKAASLFTGVAEAHGIPWDIWTMAPDGGDLKRLTFLTEDSPTPTWSLDGKWIAFAGEIGTYLVDAAGQQTLRLTTTVSSGGIVWLK